MSILCYQLGLRVFPPKGRELFSRSISDVRERNIETHGTDSPCILGDEETVDGEEVNRSADHTIALFKCM